MIPSGNPLDLEIGCGVGWHPIQYASEHPERFLIAIEHTRTRFNSFERRLHTHKDLSNLLAVHSNAIPWITCAIQAASVSRIFLLHPNPYPKKSDQNKRWHAMPFADRLIGVLKPGGEIYLATNERFYFEEARDFWISNWGLELIEEKTFTIATVPGGKPRTHFEKKYLNRGERCYELRVRRSYRC